MKPMQANPVTLEEIQSKRRCVGYAMEPKLDGWRCLASFDTQGRVTLVTRTGKDLTNKVPAIVDELERYYSVSFAPGTKLVLDGEIGFVDKMWGNWPIFDYATTCSVLGSGIGTALLKQEVVLKESNRRPTFWIFDVLHYSATSAGVPGGRDVYVDTMSPLYKRRHFLMHELLGPESLHPWYAFHDVGTLIRPVLNEAEFNERAYIEYVEAGGEGVMLKNPDAKYLEGKRPANHWYKLKKFETMDVVITGFQPAKEGKYEGLIGAVTFEGGKCSGMDDHTRELMTMSPTNYIGHVMEIRHFGQVGKDKEGYRHPQFIRMRPDKDPTY
jgi:bifunctional non-homologous end joining protein LigD